MADKSRLHLGAGLLWAHAKNTVRIKILGDRRNVAPLTCGLYVTLRCNFGCAYCGIKDNRDLGLDTAGTKILLGKIREAIPSITFTGGEPLLRHDIVELLEEAARLNFRPINLFSNLSILDKKEKVLDYIDILSTSLGSLDPSKYDRITNVRGSTASITRNIEKYSRLQREKKFILNVNCVIGSHNLDDALDVADFAFDNGCAISVGPVVTKEGNPSSRLQNSKKYRAVIDRIIESKKRGLLVLNSLRFLETIRDFRAFNCHPFTVPRIFSNGDVFYPCEILKHKRKANLMRRPSFDALFDEVRKGYGPDCRRSCFLGCYAEPSLLAENPADILKELGFYAKSRILG